MDFTDDEFSWALVASDSKHEDSEDFLPYNESSKVILFQISAKNARKNVSSGITREYLWNPFKMTLSVSNRITYSQFSESKLNRPVCDFGYTVVD